MQEINHKQYMAEKAQFYFDHSDMVHGYQEQSELEGATIRKMVTFNDGAWWQEVTEPVTEKVEVVLHGLKMKLPVRMYRTEIWTSDDGVSKFMFAQAV